MKLLDTLYAPSREFTSIPFWFLNGDLTSAEIRRQMEDFAAHGVYGVVLHPRMGLSKRIEYLSDTFFHYIKCAVETAHELGMVVVLYDEGMYPSGSAKGMVVSDHPELASVGIALTDEIEDGDQVLVTTPEGILVVRNSGGTLRGLHWGEDDREPNAPATADILNPVAVDRFIELTHEAYYRELAPYFGNTVIGFFTDEPSILGRNVVGMFDWTHGFEQDFVAAGGDLAGLSALFFGEENKDTILYHSMLLEREGEVYYGKLSKWCEAHGIALMGHPHRSDDIEVERYFHTPGQDLVLRWLAPEKSGIEGLDSTMGKCSADAARLMGRRRNSNECFGACNKDNNPWYFTGGDKKWYTDWLAVRGVNMFIVHAFYFSITGKRKEERPPDMGPNSIWWPHYRLWSDYFLRVSALMTDVEMVTPVAVLCQNRDLHPELVAPLYERQIGFQYLPMSVWEECSEDRESGELLLRGKRYQAVIGEEADRFACAHYELEEKLADCICTPAAPMLRCAHFVKDGTECWFLVNEGNDTIETSLWLPGAEQLGSYDLWRDRASRKWSVLEAGGVRTELTLMPRESVLLFACMREEYDALPRPRASIQGSVPAWELVAEDTEHLTRTYRGMVELNESVLEFGAPYIQVCGEEMAEFAVDGQPAGVSFWGPHVCELDGSLAAGEHVVEVTFTGSLANKYGRKKVPYGLM